jgi:hypothetical protein
MNKKCIYTIPCSKSIGLKKSDNIPLFAITITTHKEFFKCMLKKLHQRIGHKITEWKMVNMWKKI